MDVVITNGDALRSSNLEWMDEIAMLIHLSQQRWPDLPTLFFNPEADRIWRIAHYQLGEYVNTERNHHEIFETDSCSTDDARVRRVFNHRPGWTARLNGLQYDQHTGTYGGTKYCSKLLRWLKPEPVKQ